MPSDKLRIILLTHGGAEEVLNQLCALEYIEVAAVVVESATPRQRTLVEKIKRSIRYDGYIETFRKLLGKKSADNAGSAEDNLKTIAERNGIPYHVLNNYHAPESIGLLKSLNADLGVGFGTNILKETVFGIPKLGTINFHNGFVPYYRGGPPVFWELFNDESELGLTVHWMAAQVDAGDVILQEKVPLVYDNSYGIDYESFIADYRARLAGKFAELVSSAVGLIARGEAPRIKQDPTLGKRYRLPIKSEKDELRRRLKVRAKRAPDAQKRLAVTE